MRGRQSGSVRRSLPLNRPRRFRCDVIGHAVDAGHLIDDTGGGFAQKVVGEGVLIDQIMSSCHMAGQIGHTQYFKPSNSLAAALPTFRPYPTMQDNLFRRLRRAFAKEEIHFLSRLLLEAKLDDLVVAADVSALVFLNSFRLNFDSRQKLFASLFRANVWMSPVLRVPQHLR